MQASDLIRAALKLADQGMMTLLDDIKDAPLTQPTPKGGNHPLWVLGHIVLVEGSIPQVLFGEPNPVAHWRPLFGPGTEPSTDPGVYPSIDELLRTYRDLRARNLQILDRLDEDDLDRPTVGAPKGLEEILSTFGQTFLVVALHQMNHRGQIADCRRAAGRKAIFTPGVG